MEFSGRLASFPMPELLSWAHNDRRTGTLVIRRAQREKRIFFERGQVVACVSDSAAEYFGQHLLLHGFIDEAALLRSLTVCRQEHKRLGVVLVEQGLLDRETIQYTLRQLIEDRICDLFLWRSGLFYFEVQAPPQEEILADPIDVLALTLEGARWVDEHRRISELLPHDGIYLSRGEQWPGEGLSPLEARFSRALQGEKNLEKLYEEIKGSHFRFLATAYTLIEAGIAAHEDPGASDLTASVELNLYDLMLEQAAEEQGYTNLGAIPLDVAEKLVPVWVESPGDEEWARMPERVRTFYGRLDGQHRLGELLSEDPRRRSRDLEMLLLQLRNGRMALLPGPLEELEAAADERQTPERGRWWQRVFRNE